jgi:hypothetical protein
MEPISTLIIGEFIAAGAGWYLDSRSSNKRINTAREYLLSGINDDLKNSVALYTTIQQEWAQGERVERASLDKLKRCALTYRHNQELVPLIYQHQRGEQIFNYFNEVSDIVSAMEHDQGCINAIEEAFDDKLHSLKLENPEISADAAVTAVTALLSREQKQYYARLRRGMDASLKRLAELIHTAAELDRALR